MNIQWTLFQHNKAVQVKLVYNVYSGTKKLYIDGEKILSIRKMVSNNELNFNYEGKEYILQLIAEGYGYTGTVITPVGEKIYPDVKEQTSHKIPLWILPFVALNMAIPIISVEALTPWIIGILSSYVTAKIALKPKLNSKIKPAASFSISVLAWASYYLFYLYAKKLGIHGGFISFK